MQLTVYNTQQRQCAFQGLPMNLFVAEVASKAVQSVLSLPFDKTGMAGMPVPAAAVSSGLVGSVGRVGLRVGMRAEFWWRFLPDRFKHKKAKTKKHGGLLCADGLLK